MITTVLLQPGNRLLHGGTADFAMFGGQPTVGIDIGRATAPDGGYVTAFRPTVTSEAPDGHGGFSPNSFIPAYTAPGEAAANDPAHGSGLSAAPALDLASIAAPQVPAPTGAGSTATVASLDGPLAHADAAGGPPSIDASSPSGGAFTAPVLNGDTLAPAAAAASGLAVAEGLVSGALASAHAVYGDLGDSLSGTLAATDAVLAAGTNNVGDLVGHAGDGIASVAAQVGDQAGAAINAVGVAVGPVEALHDSVTAAALPLVDHLAAGPEGAVDVLAGSDPAGGIATLTGLVGSADLFELPAGAVPAVDAAVTSALDEVTPDGEAASPLLGEDPGLDDILHTDHDHGLAGL